MGNDNENSRTDDFLLDSFLNQSVRLKILIPIPFKIAREDGMYFMENDLFDIFSYGEDLEKARNEIESQFSTLWNIMFWKMKLNCLKAPNFTKCFF
ncbi:hypothetical protein MmiEs2_00620 [Methanimicrococcus stummii]|uniref:Uncharacterized protein n=1 Tax=Methanimicrococcus stummii TaxID=3028294 RepID=A0AA96V922_9EURY|nr:hypothetical protein MmiEs2_00620 [Methanimicrococcus sp. Es2]